MIQRKSQINVNSAEISLTLSFTSADIWMWLNYLTRVYYRVEYPENYAYVFNKLTFSKDDLIYYFTHEPRCLAWMTEKRATPIATWGIVQAEKKGYIIPVSGGYRLAERLAKKNGRPKMSEN